MTMRHSPLLWPLTGPVRFLRWLVGNDEPLTVAEPKRWVTRSEAMAARRPDWEGMPFPVDRKYW